MNFGVPYAYGIQDPIIGPQELNEVKIYQHRTHQMKIAREISKEGNIDQFQTSGRNAPQLASQQNSKPVMYVLLPLPSEAEADTETSSHS
jgi:hypothetical protein